MFGLIEKHNMNVPHQRKGWIQGAHTEAGLDIVKKRAAQWASRGVEGARELGAEDTGHLIGTDKYLGGWLDPRGGAIQPLAYAREMARVAIAAGATIHGQSPVAKLDRVNGKWVATTASGASVTADRAVVATNGYTGDLVPKLRTTVIAPNSFQVATAPLSDNVARSILPEGQSPPTRASCCFTSAGIIPTASSWAGVARSASRRGRRTGIISSASR